MKCLMAWKDLYILSQISKMEKNISERSVFGKGEKIEKQEEEKRKKVTGETTMVHAMNWLKMSKY